MVPRTALVLALLAVAGCLGAPSPASDAETPTPEPSSAPETTASPQTTVYATDCPPHLHVEAATDAELDRADAEDVVAYQDLSAERQAEFDRALEAGDAELAVVPDAWSRPRVVTHRDESYATVVSVC